MPDIKKLLSPKVIVPIVGLVVLIVVAALVAVFYISRNPTVTEGIFNNEGESTTTSEPESDFEHRVEAVTAGSGPRVLSVASPLTTLSPKPATGNDVTTTKATPTTMAPTTVPATTTVAQDTTMHAIEPVKNDSK